MTDRLNMQQQLFLSFLYLYSPDISIYYLSLLSHSLSLSLSHSPSALFSLVATANISKNYILIMHHIISLQKEWELNFLFHFILSFNHHSCVCGFHICFGDEWDVKLLNVPFSSKSTFSAEAGQRGGESRRTRVLSVLSTPRVHFLIRISIVQETRYSSLPHESREDHYWKTWTEEERYGEREGKRAREGCGGRSAWHSCGV